MLLIDPRRTIASVSPHATLVPFILKDLGGDVLQIRAFLARVSSLEWVIPLLLKEFAASGHPPRVSAALPMLILAEAARAIALGSMRVGQIVPNSVALVFLERSAMANRCDNAVRFARHRVAVDFLTRCLTSREALTAFDAALGHPRAGGKQPPPDPGERVAWLASQFMLHQLGLFQDSGDEHRLRISWIDHQAPSEIKTEAAPPPLPSLSSVAQIIQSVESTLPDLPAEISAQAQTLLDAAQGGLPFCEECAKAAMGSLGV